MLHDLHALQTQATVREVNELCKQARFALTNAYITVYIPDQMPVCGNDKKAWLLDKLNDVFGAVLHKHSLSSGDSPVQLYKDKLWEMDFSNS